jgi:hypothetical protein
MPQSPSFIALVLYAPVTVPATADPAQCPLPDGCDYRVSITIDVLDVDGAAVSNTNFIIAGSKSITFTTNYLRVFECR